MSFPSLHALLEANRGKLLEKWEEWVRRELTSANMSDGELVDSMPVFIEKLIDWLRPDSTGGTPHAEYTTARAHATERMRVGFDVATVVREYNLLHRAILEVAQEEGTVCSFAELQQMAYLISEAQAEAVAEHQRQRDAEQARQAAEHLAFLAHELRNPLSSSLTAFSLLRSGPLSEGGKLVGVLQRGLTRTSELLDNALLMGRLHGSPTLQRELVDLSRLVVEMQHEAQADAEFRQLTLEVEVAEGLSVHADPRLLRSVLSNLVRNAIKFSKPKTRVVIRGKSSGAGIVLEVEDGCGGLPQEKMTAIFDPHVQIGGDRSGFGLGLSIAKQAANAHGGTLQVHNVDDHGCVFRLELPHGTST